MCEMIGEQTGVTGGVAVVNGGGGDGDDGREWERERRGSVPAAAVVVVVEGARWRGNAVRIGTQAPEGV